ncbi:MAG: hypothetical protein PVH40_00815, partial [Gemmatimonadales bacterium]
MHRLLLVLGVGLAAACNGGDSLSSSFVVRDSAGITIIENHGQVWRPDAAWRLSSDPILVIGVAEGPEEYQLFRANEALLLSSGEILVVNG